MTTKQMEYILEVAKTLNFNQAAENLFTSQSTMSYQIKLLEDEIGFRIFERSGKGASLTPAGAQFITGIRNIYQDIRQTIEQGQNFSAKYRQDISIGLPMRSAILFLPKAIVAFGGSHPEISITPKFNSLYNYEDFLNGNQDIAFAMEEDMKRIPDVRIHRLFESKFYLITEKTDSLARKESVCMEDLRGRTLMIGGGSPPKLRALQQQIIHSVNVHYFNSQSHETTLTNVAAHKGVCIAPGFLNDQSREFAWIPFETNESISCVLCTHAGDSRPEVREFIHSLQEIYRDNEEYAL